MFKRLSQIWLNFRYNLLKPRGKRVQQAFFLKQFRKYDSKNGKEYRVSFDAGLQKLNTAYNINLPNLINQLSSKSSQFSVLEVGCGAGRGAIELMDACPNIELHATGVKGFLNGMTKELIGMLLLLKK